MDDAYVTLTKAAALLDMSPAALKRRIDRGDLAVFRNPHDLRARLIRRADLEAYAAPSPLGERTESEAA